MSHIGDIGIRQSSDKENKMIKVGSSVLYKEEQWKVVRTDVTKHQYVSKTGFFFVTLFLIEKGSSQRWVSDDQIKLP